MISAHPAGVIRALPFCLLLAALPASAGHQTNPMSAWTSDNVEHLIYFTADGLKLGEHLYEATGRFTYRTVIEPEGGCRPGEPGRRVGELTIHRETVTWSWTHYLGCKRRVMHREKRLLYQLKRLPNELCKPHHYTYQRKRRGQVQRLTLTDHCDGTVTISTPEHPVSALVSGAKQRFKSKGMTTDSKWSVRFRWRPGMSRLRPRGDLRQGGDRFRLAGTWILVETVPKPKK